MIAAALVSAALHAGIGVLVSRSPLPTRAIPATELVSVEIVAEVAEVPEDEPATRPADEAAPATPDPPAAPAATEAKPAAERAAPAPPPQRAKPRSPPTPAAASRRHRPDRREPDAVAEAASPQAAEASADGGSTPDTIAPEPSDEHPRAEAADEGGAVTGREEAQPGVRVGRAAEPEAGRAELLDVYSRAVWKRIAAHKPKGLRLPGTTRLSFTVAVDGALLAVSVVRSSGNPDLDQLALRTVREAAPLPPPPRGLRTAPLTFEISFAFR